MAVVLENTWLTDTVFRLVVEHESPVVAVPGQFCMIAAPGGFLPRPISIHDQSDDGGTLTFLIRTRGEGTRRMAEQLVPGQTVSVSVPLGTGLPPADTPLTLIGGGLGAAPLLYVARRWKQASPDRPVRVYLGFAEAPFALDGWERLGIRPVVKVGGLITDDVVFTSGDTVLACGPDVMMRAACRASRHTAAFYISMESRMACGIGACLGCSIPTRLGNRRVCKDGPVFLGEDVYEV